MLKLRNDLRNDFEAKTISAYLRACGVPSTYESRYDKATEVTHTFRWVGVGA